MHCTVWPPRRGMQLEGLEASTTPERGPGERARVGSARTASDGFAGESTEPVGPELPGGGSPVRERSPGGVHHAANRMPVTAGDIVKIDAPIPPQHCQGPRDWRLDGYPGTMLSQRTPSRTRIA